MEKHQIAITDHAYLRMKERNGWNKKTANRMVPRVYDNGKRAGDIKGYLKAWINKKIREDVCGDEFILYGQEMYIFREHTLITVLHSPARSYVAAGIY